MRRDVRFTTIVAGALALAFVVWTLLLPVWAPVDRALVRHNTALADRIGQFAALVSYVTAPTVLTLVAIALALWAFRQRYRWLAGAMLIAIVAAQAIYRVIKLLVARERPPSAASELLTYVGYSYPSGHATVATALAGLLYLTAVHVRLDPTSLRIAAGTAATWVVLVDLDRWYLSAHWASDVIGGSLLGAAIVAASALVMGLPIRPQPLAEPNGQRVLVVANPAKLAKLSRTERHVNAQLAEAGYTNVTWHTTTVDDPGRSAAWCADAERVDLVLVIGGDGTLRIVVSELVDCGIPVGVIPAGTGNLLAANLGISRDQERAVDTALTSPTRLLDLVEVVASDHPGARQPCLVMAGIGADARTLADTKDAAKLRFGVGAYLLAGVRNAKAEPNQALIAVDDRPATTSFASLVLVGNVADLHRGVTLMPDADPTDGRLDLLVASPTRNADVWKLIATTLLRRPEHDLLHREHGERVTVRLSRPDRYQIDGDLLGEADEFVFTIRPGACSVRSPERSTSSEEVSASSESAEASTGIDPNRP